MKKLWAAVCVFSVFAFAMCDTTDNSKSENLKSLALSKILLKGPELQLGDIDPSFESTCNSVPYPATQSYSPIKITFDGSLDGVTIGTVTIGTVAVTSGTSYQLINGDNCTIVFSTSGANPNDQITITPDGIPESYPPIKYTGITIDGFKGIQGRLINIAKTDYYLCVCDK